jgi:hypothetical protein
MASEIFTADGFAGFRTVKNIEIVTAAVKKYTEEVRQVFPVAKVFLFGSWAKGTASNAVMLMSVFSWKALAAGTQLTL